MQGEPKDDDRDDRVRLDRIAEGRCGTVCGFAVADDQIHQLQAMGVCRGRKVMVVRRGDPLILKVLGSRIGLSARLAEVVEVEPCTQDLCGKDC